MLVIVKYVQFWLFLLYSTYLSLTPSPNESLIETFSDTSLHCIGYLLLIVSCSIAYYPRFHLLPQIALLFGFSAVIEIAQHYTQYREFSFGDIVANLSGLLIGATLITVLWRRKQTKNNRESSDSPFSG